MVSSKRERKKLQKFLQQQELLLELHLADAMLKELRFDAKIRKEALKRARKRRVGYIQ